MSNFEVSTVPIDTIFYEFAALCAMVVHTLNIVFILLKSQIVYKTKEPP